MSVAVAPVRGAALRSVLPDLAQLRIRVFRDWPYLYDGDAAYEERYLVGFAESPGAVLVAARDGERLVGAATAAPMAEHAEEFAAPLTDAGIDPNEVFYLAESVLLPDYRGHGIGHAFFDQREAEGRAQGLGTFVFCSVIRPADHPARPADYRPLDGFWRKRGYRPLDGAVAHFPWKDIGEAEETEKPMQVWIRRD